MSTKTERKDTYMDVIIGALLMLIGIIIGYVLANVKDNNQ